MNCLKDFIFSKPRLYWIYFFILIFFEVFSFATLPEKPGLYSHNAQYLPFIATIPFVFFKIFRKNFKCFLYTYSITQFLFLTIDYLIFAHAGLLQIAFTFLPAFLFWLFLFIRWNFYQFKKKESRIALILCVIAWGLYAFAFPPLPLGPAALLLLVPWFIVLNRYDSNSAIFATFWSAMIYNSINYYWIYNVMNVETAPSGLIFLGLILLICYFSAYNVLAGFIYTLAKDIRIKNIPFLLLLFPVFYAGLEMTRTRGDFSFPWSHLGYVFGNHLELLQLLSVIGIFGYTILIIASNMIVAKALEKPGIKSKWPVITPALIFSLLFLHGNLVLSNPEAKPFYESEAENAPQIAMIQPCIKQGEKWSKVRYDSITKKTFNMVKTGVRNNTDLIILAETAIPDHIRRQPQTIRELQNISNEKNAFILTGALDFKRNREPNAIRKFEIYNASFLFSPNSKEFPERYIKKHLVPFSERIPFDDIFPILNYVDLGEGDFVPGKETPVYKPFLWTPFICYDAIFGDLVREAINAGSRLMINITNDGWFGRSTAPYQHLNLVRYRAIENGMPTARLANSGVSAFIDQYGHYDLNTKIFEDAIIQRKMQLKSRDTLYQHIGDSIETLLLWFFFGYILTIFVIKLRK